jgi:hypothetical protein
VQAGSVRAARNISVVSFKTYKISFVRFVAAPELVSPNCIPATPLRIEPRMRPIIRSLRCQQLAMAHRSSGLLAQHSSFLRCARARSVGQRLQHLAASVEKLELRLPVRSDDHSDTRPAVSIEQRNCCRFIERSSNEHSVLCSRFCIRASLSGPGFSL